MAMMVCFTAVVSEMQNITPFRCDAVALHTLRAQSFGAARAEPSPDWPIRLLFRHDEIFPALRSHRTSCASAHTRKWRAARDEFEHVYTIPLVTKSSMFLQFNVYSAQFVLAVCLFGCVCANTIDERCVDECENLAVSGPCSRTQAQTTIVRLKLSANHCEACRCFVGYR